MSVGMLRSKRYVGHRMHRPNRPLSFEAAGRTDRGKVREVNEDSVAVRSDIGLFVVADGLARSPGGAVASSLAVRAIVRFFERSRRLSPLDLRHAEEERSRLVRAFRRANERIAAAARREPEHYRMATTLAALALVGNRAVLAHVGDSRVYRVRAGRLERLTADHSVGEDATWRAENPGAPDLDNPAKQHLLTEVVGRGEPFWIATRIEPILRGDVLLVATDGLWGALWDDLILLAFQKYRTAPKPPDGHTAAD